MSRLFSELRLTLALAAPIVVGQVSQMLMGVADSAMVGRVGTVPLAAASFGGGVFNVFFVLGIGLMLPVSILVSRAFGAAKPAECGEYLRHGLALALVFGLLETLAMGVLSFALHWFKQPPEVLAVVTPFFLLLAASLVPVLVYLVLRQFAEAMGRPWMPMVVMLATVVLNVGLNWVFIYGNLGAPALGLTGAALATLLARIAGAVVIFVCLRRDPAMRAAWPQRWWGGYSLARVREMLHIGLPTAGMLFFETTAFAFSGIMMGWLGAVPLAAHQITLSCASLAFMVPLGLSTAVGMRVSRAVGAGELERRRPIVWSALGAGLVAMTGFGLLFFAAGRMIAGWFVHDPAVIVLAAHLLAVAALFQIVDGTQVIGAAALRGITDVKVPATITFAAYWVFALPLSYLLGVRGPFGAVGIWSGIAIGLACAAAALTWRFARLTRPRSGAGGLL